MMTRTPKQVLKRIVKVVITLHLVLMLIAIIDYRRKPKRKHMLAKRILKETFHAPIAPPKKAAPKKVVANPAPKKPAPKKAAPPKPKPVQKIAQAEPKKPEPVKKTPNIEVPEKQSLELVLPKAIAQLESENLKLDIPEDNSEEDSPYEAYFESVLENHLNLKPGAKVQLSVKLSRDGKVLSVKHKSSNDAFHRDFIVANIKHLQFAQFFGEIAKESEYTFNITLTGPDE